MVHILFFFHFLRLHSTIPRYVFCDKDVGLCIKRGNAMLKTLAYALEMTMDSRQKTGEATANL